MSKISEIVKLKTGYANVVELKSAFEESQENAGRMTAILTVSAKTLKKRKG